MKRLPRIIFNALAALSLVMCLGSAALWRRSMSISDYLHWLRPEQHNLLHITTGLGGIELIGITFLFDVENMGSGLSVQHATAAQYPNGMASTPVRTFMGFGVGHGISVLSPSLKLAWRTAIVPIWFVVLLFAVMPVLWLRSYRNSKRPCDGLCSSCGYDLCATPNRCPECGTVQKKAADGVMQRSETPEKGLTS